MPIKETSAKKCPHCGSNHLITTDELNPRYQQQIALEEIDAPPLPPFCFIYQCRNCAACFHFHGY